MKLKINYLIVIASLLFGCKDDRCLDASEIKHTYYFDEIYYPWIFPYAEGQLYPFLKNGAETVYFKANYSNRELKTTQMRGEDYCGSIKYEEQIVRLISIDSSDSIVMIYSKNLYDGFHDIQIKYLNHMFSLYDLYFMPMALKYSTKTDGPYKGDIHGMYFDSVNYVLGVNFMNNRITEDTVVLKNPFGFVKISVPGIKLEHLNIK